MVKSSKVCLGLTNTNRFCQLFQRMSSLLSFIRIRVPRFYLVSQQKYLQLIFLLIFKLQSIKISNSNVNSFLFRNFFNLRFTKPGQYLFSFGTISFFWKESITIFFLRHFCDHQNRKTLIFKHFATKYFFNYFYQLYSRIDSIIFFLFKFEALTSARQLNM